jgi:hypothetical protein
MRYRDTELQQAAEVQKALIGSNFYDGDFEGHITKCINFKTKCLQKARLEFESAIKPGGNLSPLEKQEALGHLVLAAQDLTVDVSKMNGAKSTKLSPELRNELEGAKLEVSKTLEHFKESQSEKKVNLPRNIDSEYIAGLLADLLKALVQMLTFGAFGKAKAAPQPSPECGR